MVSEYISELSTKSVAKRQTKTAPEVSVGSAAPVKIVGNDIRVLLKKAKKSRALERAFDVPVPDQIYDALTAQMEENRNGE